MAEVSLFDLSGKLVRSVSGCFVSSDGKLVTSAAAMKDITNAVVNTADGKIYNVAGIMANAAPFDIAVLKTEAKASVPFAAPRPMPLPDSGAHLAAVASPVTKRSPAQLELTVTAAHTDGPNQFVEVTPAIPNDLLGSPVIDEKGEFVGVVASASNPGAANVVRGTGVVEGLVSRINPNAPLAWAAEVPPPAESPTRPPMRTARIPVVQADRAGNSRLVYSPKPQFPAVAKNNAPLKGEGRYRISFDAAGRAKSVQILQPSGNPELDAAATSTLSRWKAAPGQEWNATVPVSFQP